jgi:hypothetical protein
MAMVHTVSRRPLTAKPRLASGVIPCGICGGQSDIETCVSPNSLVFPCQYHFTVALHTHISHGDGQ